MHSVKVQVKMEVYNFQMENIKPTRGTHIFFYPMVLAHFLTLTCGLCSIGLYI